MKSHSNVANSNFGLSVMHFLLRVQHEVKELLIYIRFNIVHRYQNMANSADPDETPHFAASHLGLRYMYL